MEYPEKLFQMHSYAGTQSEHVQISPSETSVFLPCNFIPCIVIFFVGLEIHGVSQKCARV